MPRLTVPRSTRTMYGSVTPASVVVVARSAGAGPTVYGLKHGFVGAGVGGFGSGSDALQFAAVVLYQSLYSVAMLHCASVAVVERPLALLAGVLPDAAWAIGVAHTHGAICEPASTGPPTGWLFTVNVADAPCAVAVITLLPFARPVTRPTMRFPDDARCANCAVTSRPPTLTLSAARPTPAVRLISTRASPPLTRSARFDSTLIFGASVGGGVPSSLPPHADSVPAATRPNTAALDHAAQCDATPRTPTAPLGPRRIQFLADIDVSSLMSRRSCVSERRWSRARRATRGRPYRAGRRLPRGRRVKASAVLASGNAACGRCCATPTVGPPD